MKLIIFDCDGTLVDSQHLIVEGWRSAFSAAGLPAPERDVMLRQVGLSINEAIEAMIGEQNDEAVVALNREYRTAFSSLRAQGSIAEPLFPGAREAIELLSQRDDVLLGMATGKSRRGVRVLLEREGWQRLFTTIQTADDAPSKPHPAMIEQAMDEVGVTTRDTVMIGDTSYDMAMAQSISVEAIGVSWGYHAPEELIEAGAVAVLKDFAELADVVFAKEKA